MSEGPQPSVPGGLLAAAIQRPVSVAAGVLLVIFFGVLALADLPIQLTPDVEIPTINVRTTWPGASPVEVESELLDPQEEVLKRVQGVQRMESTANVNRGEIKLEMAVGTSLDQALVRVSNQLSQVPHYPEGADQPVVTTANATGPPLAVILIRDERGRSVGAYRSWVLEEIIPELERVHGVASVRMRGGQDSEVHVDFRPEALAARGLTVPDVAARIRASLRSASAGDLEVGKRRMLVRTRVAPDDSSELAELVLAVGENQTPVRLRDVATVEPGLRKRVDFAIGDDRDALALLPRREAGTNVLQVTEELRAAVEALDERYFAPEGLSMQVVDDQTDYINGALDQVRSNLILGGVLATVVLLLFLRSWVASAIVALAIPICVMGTALCMTLLGRSVNVISLAGITFAVGMVVDNSIVALENIDTWRRKPGAREDAALHAIREVWGALVASTATTAAVFIPIVLWQGEVGELLRDIAYAIGIAVVVSLVVSVLVIPSMAMKFLKTKPAPSQPSAGSPPPGSRRSVLLGLFADQRDRLAERVSRLASRPIGALLVTAAFVAAAAVVSLTLLPKMEYLPTGNRNLIFGIITPPPGQSVEELRRTGFENQRVMAEHTGREIDGVPAVRRSFFVGDPGRLFVGGVAEDPARVRELRDFMQRLHSRMPGVINFASQASLFGGGIGEARSVMLELTGPDLPELITAGRKLFDPLKQMLPGARVRPQPVLDDGAPELHLFPRRSQLASAGLSAQQLGLIADTYVDGAILGEFAREGQRKRDVVLRALGSPAPIYGKQPVDPAGAARAQALQEAEAPAPAPVEPLGTAEQLAAAPVATGRGDLLPLGVLADIRTELGPMAISRIERRRAITLVITPPEDQPFEGAVETLQRRMDELRRMADIPPNVRIFLGGSAGKLVEAQTQFGGILLIALVISYLLLAGLFEDFWAPLSVMVAIPLAAAGGVLALSGANALHADIPLDLMSALGFLILIGVVVNNAILIVDGCGLRLREGYDLRASVEEAVRGRIRPIFMSTLTSLFGLAPMVINSGPGSELYRGIGTILLGGLALSTVLSIVVVPCLYSSIWRVRQALRSVAASPAPAE